MRVGNDNTVMYSIKEAVWLSGQCIRLAMWWSLVRVFLSGYLLVCSWSFPFEILSHAWLPPASWGIQSCYVVFDLFVSKYLSGVPVN